MAGEQIAKALEQRKYPPSALVPVYGVSLDKALALRGDGPIQRHLHLHNSLSDDDILAFALARSKPAKEASLQQEKPPRLIEG
jgi:hypothetical protein